MSYNYKIRLFICLSFVFCSCGGSSDLEFEGAVGTWNGRVFQAGGITCQDDFYGAGTGVEFADAEIQVNQKDGLYQLEWTTDYDCRAENDCSQSTQKTCRYIEDSHDSVEVYNDFGELIVIPRITFVPASYGCNDVKDVRFYFYSNFEAEVYTTPLPPSSDYCVSSFGIYLSRN